MANENRVPGFLGRLAPHPRSTHPRVSLENHVDFSALPTPPSVVDWCSKVANWPMYLNDQLGDCTCATVGHQIQAWSAYANTELSVPDNSVLDLYEAMGYVPGDPSTDNGANIQDVLQYMSSNGIPDGNGGTQKFSAFAEIQDLSNMTQVYQALDLFGSVYLGINVPQSAMDQFNAGQPWSDVGDTNILGGHAIPLQKKDASGNLSIITWGAVQEMEQSFWTAYVEEAWVVVNDEDWLNAKSKETPGGLNVTSLMADFKSLGG